MSLEKIFHAGSVAIIGASKDDTKRGFQAIRTLTNEKYEGRIYPVNPKEKNILGLKCYPTVSDIEDPVDIALIVTPAKTLDSILKECGKKGIKGAVVIAGGFGELGKEGKKFEEHVIEVAKENNIRIVGPNTSGIMNMNENLNLVGIRDAPKGDIALITQSGNMALALITEAKLKSQKGFSYYVGVGNEADIKFHEYLRFFRQDESTKAILMYVEGMRMGREFLQEAYKTTSVKPIILLKSGRSSTGRRSAGSHTGALAGISEVSRSAFQRAGIIVVESSDELFPVAETLSTLYPIKNNNIAILADGGGHATIAADILSELGVNIPTLSKATQTHLQELLPEAASIKNPIDVAGGTDANPGIFADCADIILKDPDVGGLLIVGLFGGYGIRFSEKLKFIEEDAAHRMGKLVRKRHKPILFHSLYNSERPHSLQLLRYYNIPVYDSLEVACKCIGSLAHYGRYLGGYHAKANFVFNWRSKAKPEGEDIIKNAKKENRTVLFEYEAKRILELHGIEVLKEYLATSADEAIQFAKRIEGPVVMKIVSKDILHKNDVGGVRLKLDSEEKIRQAYDEIIESALKAKPDAEIKGILVSPTAKQGIEVIIGTKIDEQFGPIILFGLGGVMVELLNDTSTRVLPISRRSARKMIEDIKTYPILEGARGTPTADKSSLVNTLIRISEVIESYPEIQEMDLNPVFVYEVGNGVCAVDARIILREE